MKEIKTRRIYLGREEMLGTWDTCRLRLGMGQSTRGTNSCMKASDLGHLHARPTSFHRVSNPGRVLRHRRFDQEYVCCAMNTTISKPCKHIDSALAANSPYFGRYSSSSLLEGTEAHGSSQPSIDHAGRISGGDIVAWLLGTQHPG